jgi:hypothetical protein
MAYERAWQFAYNRSFTPTSTLQLSKWQLWTIKALLLGHVGGMSLGNWTLIGSSNGTTGALDAVDRWVGVGNQNTSFDATTEASIPRVSVSGLSSPCGWVVLRSPAMAGHGQQYYLCISFSTLSGTVQDYYCNFRWAKAPFTIAATATWPPVAPADAWGSTSNKDTPTQVNNGTFGTATHRMNAMLSPTGDFLIYSVRQNSFISEFCVMAMAPVAYRVSDQYAIYTASNYGSTLANGGAFQPSQTTGNLFAPGAHNYDASNSASSNFIVPFASVSGCGFPDAVDGTLMDFPAWVLGSNAIPRAWMRGRLPDTGIMPNFSAAVPVATGSAVRDGQNNLVYITLGSFIVPSTILPDMS